MLKFDLIFFAFWFHNITSECVSTHYSISLLSGLSLSSIGDTFLYHDQYHW